jgi:hypothetical protein
MSIRWAQSRVLKLALLLAAASYVASPSAAIAGEASRDYRVASRIDGRSLAWVHQGSRAKIVGDRRTGDRSIQAFVFARVTQSSGALDAFGGCALYLNLYRVRGGRRRLVANNRQFCTPMSVSSPATGVPVGHSVVGIVRYVQFAPRDRYVVTGVLDIREQGRVQRFAPVTSTFGS